MLFYISSIEIINRRLGDFFTFSFLSWNFWHHHISVQSFCINIVYIFYFSLFFYVYVIINLTFFVWTVMFCVYWGSLCLCLYNQPLLGNFIRLLIPLLFSIVSSHSLISFSVFRQIFIAHLIFQNLYGQKFQSYHCHTSHLYIFFARK